MEVSPKEKMYFESINSENAAISETNHMTEFFFLLLVFKYEMGTTLRKQKQNVHLYLYILFPFSFLDVLYVFTFFILFYFFLFLTKNLFGRTKSFLDGGLLSQIFFLGNFFILLCLLQFRHSLTISHLLQGSTGQLISR